MCPINAGACQHVYPWLAKMPPLLRRSVCTVCYTLSAPCRQAPLPPGHSHSLIMINIQLEAIHYWLGPNTCGSGPPTHLHQSPRAKDKKRESTEKDRPRSNHIYLSHWKKSV